jgi:hypothetical protein
MALKISHGAGTAKKVQKSRRRHRVTLNKPNFKNVDIQRNAHLAKKNLDTRVRHYSV